MTLSNSPVASAILAVYNAESDIIKAVESLLLQSVPIEIIIVDDGSTDATLAKLKIYKDVTILKQNHGGPALARNLGASHARSNILLFVDADMIFDKDYVRDLIIPIQKGEIIGTYTIEERVENWDNVWAKCWNIEEGWEDKKRFPKNPPKFGTDFRAIFRSEFDRVGGFDNIGYTDTWSLFHKLNQRPLATKAICYHKNPDSLKSVFTQARWSAKRPYKLGYLGTLFALVRTSLPISLVVGISKSIIKHNANLLVFKIVYDFGRFVGISEMLLTGKLSK
jgi:glycosyltransferase involved in cell wall biosynthesis